MYSAPYSASSPKVVYLNLVREKKNNIMILLQQLINNFVFINKGWPNKNDRKKMLNKTTTVRDMKLVFALFWSYMYRIIWISTLN